MKNSLVLLVLFLPAIVFAQKDSVESKAYDWKKPSDKVQKDISSTTLFEGNAHDMSYLKMNANSIVASKKKINLHVPAQEEHLLIIKTGAVTIGIKDSTWTIGAGSIALLMPGEKYTLQSSSSSSCDYFEMRYRSKLTMDLNRGLTAGSSFIKDWNKIAFKPHERGGIRNYFERPTAMCKRLEMHVSTLKPGIKSHEPHTHRAEEIVLLIEGNTEMQIADKFYKGKAGSIYYLGSNVLHAIRNEGTTPSTYFAFQFE